MPPWSWGRYGSCEGLAGTLNKLANRGNGRIHVGQSPSQFNFMSTETNTVNLQKKVVGRQRDNSLMVGDMTLGSQNRKEVCEQIPSLLGPKYLEDRELHGEGLPKKSLRQFICHEVGPGKWHRTGPTG